MESHSSFCFPFTLAEFLAAAFNLSSSTATGPDKVAYPMLKHLPRSGINFFLPIFNLSWSSHSFPSIWKTSSIYPIHNMVKPLDSPASFRPISLTSCVSKLFERIILSRLLFFLESNSILSPRQAGFRPEWSTLDQILHRSQSISDGFNKPRPESRTILSTIDFSKVFDSVWHLALSHKLISADFPPCFARWTQSFYADDLAIWSSFPLVPTAVEATQGALFRLERWSEHGCLPLNLSKCEVIFFSVDPHQTIPQPHFLLLGTRLRFSSTPAFLGLTFDRTLSFSNHVCSLKAEFFPHLKALRCISACSWGPLKSPSLSPVQSFSSVPSHLRFTWMVSFPKR